ncbi:MAG: histone deacetylase [Pseudomonadota bacterium]
MLPIVHHPHYQIPLRHGHRFPMSKYGYLRQGLEGLGLVAPGTYPAPAPANAGQLTLAHDIGYVSRVLDQTLSPEETRAIGLPNTPEVSLRSRLTSSGTLLAAWLALETGLAANSAGGSHHANRSGGSGFCVFNDVAVAAANLLAAGIEGPVLVVDADVHQGDGTAAIFAGDDRVFTFSIHAENNFPSDKATSDLDIGLPDGTGDSVFLAALESGLRDCLSSLRPALVFYNAGVDIWEHDRLGRLAVSRDGIRQRERLVLETVRSRGIALCCVVGGGYGDNAEVADRHLIFYEECIRYLAKS